MGKKTPVYIRFTQDYRDNLNRLKTFVVNYSDSVKGDLSYIERHEKTNDIHWLFDNNRWAQIPYDGFGFTWINQYPSGTEITDFKSILLGEL